MTPEAGFTQLSDFVQGVASDGRIMTTYRLDAVDVTPQATAAGFSASAEIRSAQMWPMTNAAEALQKLDVPLSVGDRIKQVDIQGRHVGASGTFTGTLWKLTKSGAAAATPTQVGTVTSSSGSTSDEEISISGLTETVAADTAYYIEWTATAVADQRFYGASITYDRP